MASNLFLPNFTKYCTQEYVIHTTNVHNNNNNNEKQILWFKFDDVQVNAINHSSLKTIGYLYLYYNTHYTAFDYVLKIVIYKL